MVVHRRLDTFDRRAASRPGCSASACASAANYRRAPPLDARGAVGRQRGRTAVALAAADDILVRREQRELAERALNRWRSPKRATFVMFELESLSCLEIAELMNVPVGTVYSRLHSARRQLEKAVEPRSSRDEAGE
jgi:RNA polymerase sigma-70 factor (ECF subfamily)